MIGVCLGAQLIAAAMGTSVYPAKNKEIRRFGVEKTKQAKSMQLVKALTDSLDVSQASIVLTTKSLPLLGSDPSSTAWKALQEHHG